VREIDKCEMLSTNETGKFMKPTRGVHNLAVNIPNCFGDSCYNEIATGGCIASICTEDPKTVAEVTRYIEDAYGDAFKKRFSS
jgi:hypothetical protein